MKSFANKSPSPLLGLGGLLLPARLHTRSRRDADNSILLPPYLQPTPNFASPNSVISRNLLRIPKFSVTQTSEGSGKGKEAGETLMPAGDPPVPRGLERGWGRQVSSSMSPSHPSFGALRAHPSAAIKSNPEECLRKSDSMCTTPFSYEHQD